MRVRLIAMGLVSLGLLIGALFLANVPPMAALRVLLHDSLGSPQSLAGTVRAQVCR